MSSSATFASSSHFNPRSSCEERRALIAVQHLAELISIHAPHARSDSIRLTAASRQTHFNPRSSCEERRIKRYSAPAYTTFQSTLLMRGATPSPVSSPLFYGKFQSTLLMRGATEDIEGIIEREIFQSTLLMRGATRRPGPSRRPCCHFNPRSSCEERRSAGST